MENLNNGLHIPRPQRRTPRRPPHGAPDASALLAGCASAAGTAPATPAAAPASSLGTVLGIDPSAAGNGKDLTWKLGAALPMSGPGAPQGTEMKQAIDLAIEQIRASGGPAISLSVKDIKNPDPVASKQAARELADEKVAAKITSYGDGLGAMLEDTAKDQILTLDGVGGAQPFAVGAPVLLRHHGRCPRRHAARHARLAQEGTPGGQDRRPRRLGDGSLQRRHQGGPGRQGEGRGAGVQRALERPSRRSPRISRPSSAKSRPTSRTSSSSAWERRRPER